MSNDPNKYPVLKGIADRVNQKQPDEIHLIAARRTIIRPIRQQLKDIQRRFTHLDLPMQGFTRLMCYKFLTPDSIVKEFEKTWADGTQWRKGRGGISATRWQASCYRAADSRRAIARWTADVLSRGGQPTRTPQFLPETVNDWNVWFDIAPGHPSPWNVSKHSPTDGCSIVSSVPGEMKPHTSFWLRWRCWKNWRLLFLLPKHIWFATAGFSRPRQNGET
jgi:hypothetical protein